MDFGLLPPEVNSARMYAGPGSGPMFAAAAAWDGLAAELQSTASSYQSAIAGLIAGPWLGPSAGAMAAAAAPYVAWIRSTAAQAEQTANQATAAAAAYDAAFAVTVPPPVVAANRTLLMALVATNFFGQNTPAIATTETQYTEMWAQDTAAMYDYAGASASATTLTPFTSPPQTTNSGGLSDQAGAVGQATGTSAGNAQNIVSSVQQAFSAVPNTLQSLTTAAQAAAADPPLTTLSDLITVLVDAPASLLGIGVDTPFSIFSYPPDVLSYYIALHTDDVVSGWAGIEAWPGIGPVPPTPFPVITNLGSPVSAGLGEANTVGALSVPTAWAAAAPEVRPLAVALPATSVAAAEASAGSAGSLFSQMALAGMAGRAMAGTTGTGGTGHRERIGERIGAPTHKPAAPPQPEHPTEPPQSPAGGPITGIAAELRELAALRDSGILTDEEFTEQKRRLLPC